MVLLYFVCSSSSLTDLIPCVGWRGGTGRDGTELDKRRAWRHWTGRAAGRHGKIFLIVVFVLPFSNTFVSFSISTVLQSKNNKVRLVLCCCFIYCLLFFLIYSSPFLAGVKGRDKQRVWDRAGRAAGRNVIWWDGTIGGRRGAGCGGTIGGAG